MRPIGNLVSATALVVAIAAAFLASPFDSTEGRAAGDGTKWVDAAGNMRIPTNYRASYEYLGSWSIAGDEKGAKQIHAVYASPGTAAAYRKDGKFPDGAILIKEVYNASTAEMTTGTVSHEDALVGWFMLVKDSKNSHPANKLWGNGWGWSWFDAGNPTKTTSTDFHADCLGCHIPAQASDWIYVSGYPVLKK